MTTWGHSCNGGLSATAAYPRLRPPIHGLSQMTTECNWAYTTNVWLNYSRRLAYIQNCCIGQASLLLLLSCLHPVMLPILPPHESQPPESHSGQQPPHKSPPVPGKEEGGAAPVAVAALLPWHRARWRWRVSVAGERGGNVGGRGAGGESPATLWRMAALATHRALLVRRLRSHCAAIHYTTTNYYSILYLSILHYTMTYELCYTIA